MRTHQEEVQTLFAFVAILLTGSLASRATILTMDELPFQAVNDLSFKGVTFHFTINGVSSLDANYHSDDGGNEKFVQDPSLEGNSFGVLTLDFSAPTSGLQFGVARSDPGPMAPGLKVALFDEFLNPLGSFNLDTRVFTDFSEGLFSSELTIGRAVLSFPNPNSAPRFAIDNLTINEVPEPATRSLLTLSGLALLCLRRSANFAKCMRREVF